MKEAVANLATPVVRQEVAKVLETYPDHPYQKAFANPELRQQLIAHVLTEVNCKFTVAPAGQQPEASYETLFPSTEEQSHLENSIRQGIERLLQEKGDWVNQHIPSPKGSQDTTSQWFG